MKKSCWNRSGIDEIFCWNGIAIYEKKIAEIEAVLLRRILLKWRWDWWKHTVEIEAGWIKNIAEMEARLMKNIAEMEADWWKNIAEMEVGFTKNIGEWIFCAELFATNCRAELSNAELSCAELFGHRLDVGT